MCVDVECGCSCWNVHCVHRIANRRDNVVDRRDRVKSKAQERHEALLAAKAYQEFKRDAAELSDWIQEKYVTATDESWRDLTNLLPKLQKHQAFEAELNANSERLQVVNQVGCVTSHRFSGLIWF